MRSTLVGSLLLLILTEAAPAFAQTQFTTLASFAGGNGKDPLGGLVLSGGTLFGTTSQGGQYGWGTVFSLPVSNGTINTMTSFGPPGVNSGVAPDAGLVLSGNTLYGTLSATYSVALGYANGNEGNVFSIPVSGGTPTNLESLAGHVNFT